MDINSRHLKWRRRRRRRARNKCSLDVTIPYSVCAVWVISMASSSMIFANNLYRIHCLWNAALLEMEFEKQYWRDLLSLIGLYFSMFLQGILLRHVHLVFGKCWASLWVLKSTERLQITCEFEFTENCCWEEIFAFVFLRSTVVFRSSLLISMVFVVRIAYLRCYWNVLFYCVCICSCWDRIIIL